MQPQQPLDLPTTCIDNQLLMSVIIAGLLPTRTPKVVRSINLNSKLQAG
jgi:hypothetical protein